MNPDDLIQTYWDLPDSKLYEELGRSLLGEDALGIGGSGLNRLRRYGQEKWRDSQRLLAKAVCTGNGDTKFTDGYAAIGQGLVAAVCEVLSFNETEGALVSVLLLRFGLSRFCNNKGPDGRVSVPA